VHDEFDTAAVAPLWKLQLRTRALLIELLLQVVRAFRSMVFDIVDMERETQAAASWRRF
jgi:hypothetical protein